MHSVQMARPGFPHGLLEKDTFPRAIMEGTNPAAVAGAPPTLRRRSADAPPANVAVA